MNKTYLLLVVSAFAPGLLLACSGSDPVPGDDEGREEADCVKDADCDDGLFCTGTETCDAGVCVTTDNCLPGQDCDEGRALCETDCEVDPDADGDGHEAVECDGDDCDDSDADRYPSNVEVCDSENVDEDCDPLTFGALDEDDDGFDSSACCNESGSDLVCGLDCNDKDRGTNPNVPEVCDGHDTNCNGIVDDGGDLFWEDSDKDMYGNAEVEVRACEPPSGYVRNKDDCDDEEKSIHPGADESTCNAIDNDCDGDVDEDLTTGMLYTLYVDADGDGHGDATAAAKQFCQATAAGYANSATDCFDDQPNVHPGAIDICDGLVNACKTSDTVLGYDSTEDADGDGFAASDATCEEGGFEKLDCDDADDSRHPDSPELCNDVDDDCDLVVDDGCPSSISLDVDNTVTVVLAMSESGQLTMSCPAGMALHSVTLRAFNNGWDEAINGAGRASGTCGTPSFNVTPLDIPLGILVHTYPITRQSGLMTNVVDATGAGTLGGSGAHLSDNTLSNDYFVTGLSTLSDVSPYIEALQLHGTRFVAQPNATLVEASATERRSDLSPSPSDFDGQPTVTCDAGSVVTAVTFGDLTAGVGGTPEGGLQLLSIDCTPVAVQLIPAE